MIDDYAIEKSIMCYLDQEGRLGLPLINLLAYLKHPFIDQWHNLVINNANRVYFPIRHFKVCSLIWTTLKSATKRQTLKLQQQGVFSITSIDLDWWSKQCYDFETKVVYHLVSRDDASIRFNPMSVQRAKLSVSQHRSSWSGMQNSFLVEKAATSWSEISCKFVTSNSSIARSVEDVKQNNRNRIIRDAFEVSLLVGTVRFLIINLWLDITFSFLVIDLRIFWWWKRRFNFLL